MKKGRAIALFALCLGAHWQVAGRAQVRLPPSGVARITLRAVSAVRVIAPLREHLESAGLHRVSEIADGDAPHAARGCPFQAWSVGELLRVVTWLSARGAERASAA